MWWIQGLFYCSTYRQYAQKERRVFLLWIIGSNLLTNRAIQPDFPAHVLQRYIRFARSLHPQFTKEAAEELKRSFVRIRTSDLSYQKSAYKITIRQLESIIRLSEALARVHCSLNILPEYVKEAERLLSNSILKIDRPDLEIEPFDETADLNANRPSDENNIIVNIDFLWSFLIWKK